MYMLLLYILSFDLVKNGLKFHMGRAPSSYFRFIGFFA